MRYTFILIETNKPYAFTTYQVTEVGSIEGENYWTYGNNSRSFYTIQGMQNYPKELFKYDDPDVMPPTASIYDFTSVMFSKMFWKDYEPLIPTG